MSYMQADLYSDCLNRYVSVGIILPEGAKGRIPTLYLLHGMTDDETCWQRRSSIERYSDETGIAVIMPGAGLSWYCDTPSGENYFQYVSDELVRATRRMLPRLSDSRENTFVGGISMGGYGAMKCLLSRPDMFSAAVCLSGALDPVQNARLVDKNTAGDFDWAEAFGPLEFFPGSPNDLETLVYKVDMERIRVYMWCGTEDSLLPLSRKMRAQLKCSLNYHETPGGHEWQLWDREILYAMRWLREGEV